MAHKSVKLERLKLIAVGVLSGVIVLSLAGFVKPVEIGKSASNRYSDRGYQIAFDYPKNYTARISESGSQKYMQIFPNHLESEIDPRIIEVVYDEDTNSEQPVEKNIYSSFPESSRNNLRKIQIGQAAGYQIQDSDAQETIIYSYVKSNGFIYLFKFTQSYYENNASAQINNRSYLGAYYKVLNSVDFDPQTD
jgi:hypothetical protein